MESLNKKINMEKSTDDQKALDEKNAERPYQRFGP